MKQKVNINPVTEHHVACDVCHRTMLKGERAEPYLTPSRERRLVCQLCAPRAQREGWIREAAAPEMPARPQRPPERRGLLRRRRTAKPDPDVDVPVPHPVDPTPTSGMVDRLDDDEEPRRLLGRRSRPRSPRHVKAVPTNAQLKIGRALDLFNGSEHPRTVAGIARTLGTPHASASTSKASAAEVLLTVAWELSWYQFGVDLSDGREPVRPRGQGQELSELPAEAQEWNCTVDQNGRIELGNGSDEEAAAESPGAAPEPLPAATPQHSTQSAGESAERPV
ncbi:MAG: hypothetical protein ACRDLQ_07820 [Solirubrobacterales bacterium]